MTMNPVWTKQGGEQDLGHQAGNGAASRGPNPVAGEVEVVDHAGHKVVLRPTFEAALEIEDALGTGLESLRTRLATSGLPGMPSATTREYGVILAAGVRAAGDSRATPERAARYVFEMGRERLRKPLLDFIWALTDGGRLREEDLKKRGSSPSSPAQEDAEEGTTEELIERLSASTSA